jgi:hypothetical protein
VGNIDNDVAAAILAARAVVPVDGVEGNAMP